MKTRYDSYAFTLRFLNSESEVLLGESLCPDGRCCVKILRYIFEARPIYSGKGIWKRDILDMGVTFFIINLDNTN